MEEAVNMILDRVEPGTLRETVSLEECGGRILSDDVISPLSNPPFDRSPVDGYGCRSEDLAAASAGTPVRLRVVREIDAGQHSAIPISKGEAVRIMTGAAIPKGCDCCVRQEDTDYGEEWVEVYKHCKRHENYCFMGEDFHKGDKLLEVGQKLSYVEIGILAGMGYDQVSVWRRPKIAVFTTGDEVVRPGQALPEGKIYNSNLYLLSSRLRELGLPPALEEMVGDDAVKMAGFLTETAKWADIIITTGGVSVGKKDIFHEALDRAGASKIFWKIKIKPGTPTIFSMLEGVPVISLSGNPFGALANFEILLRPVLSKLSRDPSLMYRRADGMMTGTFSKASPGRRLVRARWQDGLVTVPDGLHSSGVLGTMAGCNCMIDIAPGSGGLFPGDKVKVILL